LIPSIRLIKRTHLNVGSIHLISLKPEKVCLWFHVSEVTIYIRQTKTIVFHESRIVGDSVVEVGLMVKVEGKAREYKKYSDKELVDTHQFKYKFIILI
jgi:hypothetical protein